MSTNQKPSYASKSAPSSLQGALIYLVPRSPYEAIVLIGIICGIGYYIAMKDSWLLATFLGMMAGTTIQKAKGRVRRNQGKR